MVKSKYFYVKNTEYTQLYVKGKTKQFVNESFIKATKFCVCTVFTRDVGRLSLLARASSQGYQKWATGLKAICITKTQHTKNPTF